MAVLEKTLFGNDVKFAFVSLDFFSIFWKSCMEKDIVIIFKGHHVQTSF